MGLGGAFYEKKLGSAGLGKNDCGKDGTAGSCKTVELGGKTWMVQNLNYKTVDSWCYGNKESNCNYYGRLYTWEAAKSACQSVGWRLPDTAAWRNLVTAAGGSSAGNALKSTFGWSENGNGTDKYGFSALPGGGRYSAGSFNPAGDYGYWWTDTEYSDGSAYYRNMGYDDDYVYENNDDKSNGFSVRCVKDVR